jgi:group I intron endonuclease
MKHPGIYLIESKLNNKQYIGSSINVYVRVRGHKRDLLKNRHANIKLQNHYNKYGIDDFTYTLVEECDIDVLIEREQYWYDKLNPEFCIRTVVDSCLGVKQSEETKLKRGKAIKQFYIDNPVTKKYKKEVSIRLRKTHKDKRNTPSEYKLYYITEVEERALGGRVQVECVCKLCGYTSVRLLTWLKGTNRLNECCIRKEKRCKVGRYARNKIVIRVKRISQKPNYDSKLRANNSTGYTGVTFCKASQQYRARIKHKGKLLNVARDNDMIKCVIKRNEYIKLHSLPHCVQIIR